MTPDFFEQHDEEWLTAKLQERQISKHGVQFEEHLAKLQKIKSQYLAKVPDFLFTSNIVRESIFERVLYLMDWGFFMSSEAQPFITCDNPVVFSKGRGLKHNDAVIFFPLSQKLCLQAMWKSNYRGTYFKPSNSEIGLINRYIVQNADREVYASYKSRVMDEFVKKWIDTFESPEKRTQQQGRPRKKRCK